MTRMVMVKPMRKKFASIGAAIGLIVGLLAATPANAAPGDVPEGVEVAPKMLYRVDESGAVTGSGPVGPGQTFFAVYEVRNTTDAPVTVTGFEVDFWFTMHPTRQGGLPDDHCLQFFEARSFPDRQFQQSYPLVVLPGDTVELYDNTTYHYIQGLVSNECQGGSFSFGAPVFLETEVDSGPVDTEAPLPPQRIETATA